MITVKSIAYHRNGVCGAGFHVVLFDAHTEGQLDLNLVAVMFDVPEEEEGETRGDDDEIRTAVLGVQKLSEGNIAFGSNSYRGDTFDRELIQAIQAWRRLPIEEQYPAFQSKKSKGKK